MSDFVKLDGKKVSESVLSELKDEVAARAEGTPAPGLAVVLVGERKDSQTYVRMKKKAAEGIGIHFVEKVLPENIDEEALLGCVRELNADATIHGIIVQLPLPKHITEQRVLQEIDLAKDVDGFHPDNIGRLGMRGREPLFVSCTPKGCMEILKRYNIETEGKKAVVLGRSNIVGLPAALLLNNANATVTVCHSRTPDLAEEVRRADIVVAAIGKPQMVKKDWIKPGATVIDVGINAIDDPEAKRGYRLVGDVDYDGVKEVAGAATPVPGGVGPMTVAMLMSNTLAGWRRCLPK